MEQMMTLKEATRLSVMKNLQTKKMSTLDASDSLGLSCRQVFRLKRKYLIEGDLGLISKRRGMPSPTKIPQRIKNKVLKLIKKKYSDFGPTLACEKLEENHQIKLSRETLRYWLIEEGIWKAKRKKEAKLHPRRARRPRLGDLIQVDGSYHAWFEERGEKCCLLVFIDDATSKIMYARFCNAETTQTYMEGMSSYIEMHGKPRSIYSDKHSVFRVNREEVQKGAKQTQMGRALEELGIELICANSPQAKGRVERANGILQDRLVKEMRLKKIKTIGKANEYLPDFIKKYNQKFGKLPTDQTNGHKKMEEQIDEILVTKASRTLSKDLSFQYHNTQYQIESKTPNRLKHKKVEIIDSWGGQIKVKYQDQVLKYNLWNEMDYKEPKVAGVKELESSWKTSKVRRPKKSHPWR